MATATGVSPSPATHLSSNDAAVLQALFDADSSASSSTLAKIDSSLPSFPSISSLDPSSIQSVKERELAVIRRIQNVSDNKKLSVLDEAIKELDGLIKEAPDYPPLYANRAQALRMLIQASSSSAADSENSNTKDNALFLPNYADSATRLWSDLTQAITLSTPSQQTASVSPAQARLLSNAHTHRGYILLKAAKIRKETPQEAGENITKGGPQQLRKISTRDELEEMASRDFFQAGRYGNDVAREVSVQTNPYAKMCGTIVKEALRKEIEEFQ
ncbi:hypothetical protein PISL3812_01359 [Talaromyces islandicus]|uniref:Tetratricopeptide repeat protein 36 homolog n=1 Tax=Talaromyces islandicus TaxID=28573 RepID=A0A0U1LLX5_TALIS|nr:hypothetical protein PISL3812_01359 [Talaromyces islandicus]